MNLRDLSRRALLLSGLTGAALAASTRAGSASRKATRPNILLAIADDWGYPHAGGYGDPAARTPTFDRLSAEGALFTRAFTAAPTCTASRGALLTGQAPHRLEEGANLHGFLPAHIDTYPDLLERAGYRIGKRSKGWGPGGLEGRTRNPAGPDFASFADFLAGQSADTPFCFWFGSNDPHRPYDPELGEASGIDPVAVEVPPYLPDSPEVRADIVNYLAEVQRFDREVGEALELLEERGLAENTLVVVTGDHAWPFPRAKANVYDTGTRVPLAVRWPGRVRPGTVSDRLTSLTDLAPTFLEAAGLEVPPDLTGESLLPTLTGSRPAVDPRFVVIERERHGMCRAPNLGYAMRAWRTERWLYVRNFFPERWPAGDPDFADGWRSYGDIDDGPTKTYLLQNRDDPACAELVRLATAKRGAEELYDVQADPHTMRDVAEEYPEVTEELGRRLRRWMRETGDPRAERPRDTFWDTSYYVGPEPPS